MSNKTNKVTGLLAWHKMRSRWKSGIVYDNHDRIGAAD